MKNLHKFAPILVMATMAAVRLWVVPHINIPAFQTLLFPLEVAAYAVSVYAYARKPTGLMAAYIAVTVFSLLMFGMFNFIFALIALIK